MFGIKGGAAGGGKSQVLPMESFNLHLTGDTRAVSLAHNLLATVIDSHLAHGNKLDIDPVAVTWPRVIDLNDRALRRPAARDALRHCSCSEVMAVLALGRDLKDLRKRLAAITIGDDCHKKSVTAGDLGVAGSMAVLLKKMRCGPTCCRRPSIRRCSFTPARSAISRTAIPACLRTSPD